VAPTESTDVTFRLAFTFTAAGNTQWMRAAALVPTTIPHRQVVWDVRWEPEPVRVFDAGENRYAEFFFPRPRGTFRVQITGKARLFRSDLSVARAAGIRTNTQDLRPYLHSEPSIESDDPAVAAAARPLRGDDEFGTLKRIYDFVLAHMTYGGPDLSQESGGAVKALQTRKGDCTEYTDLMVALCRANGIPARHVLGLDAAPGTPTRQHAWPEAFTRKHGWVSFDPTFDACAKAATFEKLSPRYLRFSAVRNDQVMENYNSYAMYRYWGDPVTLKEEYDIRPALHR
jgi:transglutaminase-like putative cysteine protease